MPDNESTARLSLDIDGLKRGLREARQEIQRANAVFKAETAGMEDWTKDADGLSAKLKNLGDVLSKQRYILDNYNDQVKKHRENQEQAAGEAERLRKEMQALSEKGVEPAATEYKKLEKQYQAAIKSERAEAEQVKKLETNIISQTAEINKTEAAYKKWERAQDDLARESRSLVKIANDQEKELKDLKDQYVAVAATEGKNSDTARELAGRIRGLSSDLNANKKAIQEAEKNADRLDHTYDDLGASAVDAGKDAQKAGGLFSKAKDYIIGGLAVQAITRTWDALKNAVKDAARAMSDAIVSGAAYADNILTLSSQTGLATDTLQEFAYMEDLIDVSSGTVAKSLARLKKQMGSAQNGSKSAAAAFEKLGVAYEDANGHLRSGEEVFYDVIDALGAMENETERDAVAMDIFGRSATELNPLIEAGADKLQSFRDEAHEVGAILSGPSLEALGKAQDGMDRLGKVTEGVKNQFAVGLAPAVSKATSQIADTLTSPRTRRGIELLSEGIGGLLSSLSDFAVDGINGLLDALGLFDVRLASYTDEQLAALQATDTLQEKMGYLHEAYLNSAEAAESERARTEELWKELQTLADEDGKVLEANQDRANYLLHELNAALGTEYELNNGVIKQYGEMRDAIKDLIIQQEVQSLLAAGEEEYAEALRESSGEAGRAASFYADLVAVEQDLEAQAKKVAAAEAAWRAADEDMDSRNHPKWDAYQKELGLQNDLQDQYEALRADYEKSSAAATKYAETIQRTEAAKEAAYSGEYETARQLLTKELDDRRAAHAETEKISQEDVITLREQYAKQHQAALDYKEKYRKGLSGYTKPVLEELLAQETETRKILDRIAAGATTWGDALGANLSAGLIKGMASYDARIEAQARKQVNAALQVMRSTAQIASPSKVTEGYGEFLDLGWVKGMKAKLSLLRATAADVAETAMTPRSLPSRELAASAAAGQAQAQASGPRSVSFTQNIYAPKTPSRLELYRDSKNLLELAGGL